MATPSVAAACLPAHNAPDMLAWVPGSTIRIGLPHMDVVLTIATEPAGDPVGDSGFAMQAMSDGMQADPVIERLLHQLGRTETYDEGDGVYGDAIRLALAARWLRVRSQEDQPSAALQKWRLKRVVTYIDEHISEAISLNDLARIAGLSRMYFAAKFRAATGLRPHEYILRRRVEQAKDMLAKTNESLVEIAFNVGFQTQAHFTTVFKRFVGATPGRWRLSRQFD